jgi:hypothetical protein
MEQGQTIPQYLRSQKLEGNPSFIRKALIEEYGEDEIRRIIQDIVRPAQKAMRAQLARAGHRVSRKGRVFKPKATSEKYNERMNICKACDKLSDAGKCTACTCAASTRAAMEDGTCPHPDGPKWE